MATAVQGKGEGYNITNITESYTSQDRVDWELPDAEQVQQDGGFPSTSDSVRSSSESPSPRNEGVSKGSATWQNRLPRVHSKKRNSFEKATHAWTYSPKIGYFLAHKCTEKSPFEGWSAIYLNPFQRFARKAFGLYPETHKEYVESVYHRMGPQPTKDANYQAQLSSLFAAKKTLSEVLQEWTDFTPTQPLSKYYISYDPKKQLWDVKILNALQRICRLVLGLFQSTHMNTIRQGYYTFLNLEEIEPQTRTKMEALIAPRKKPQQAVTYWLMTGSAHTSCMDYWIRPKTYFSYSFERGGWSVKQLNIVQRICRFLFGMHEDTHLKHVREMYQQAAPSERIDVQLPNIKDDPSLSNAYRSALFPCDIKTVTDCFMKENSNRETRLPNPEESEYFARIKRLANLPTEGRSMAVQQNSIKINQILVNIQTAIFNHKNFEESDSQKTLNFSLLEEKVKNT